MLAFSQVDRRRYPTVSVREGYREWQPTYETTVEDEMDRVLLDGLESIAWPAVQRAADLGCGTGRTGAWLKAHGVTRIDGIDLTPEMLAIASTLAWQRRAKSSSATPARRGRVAGRGCRREQGGFTQA